MEDYLSQLNDQQRAAVEYLDGPQLVIAGAGSGKTRVLTYKIVHLLENGYEPWRILALTFTNKAAREMRERIQMLTGPSVASKLWMGTFHSIFARILRRHATEIGYKSSFTIYDTADSKSLVKLILKDMDLATDKRYQLSTVMNTISWAKNALISPEQYAMNAELMKADSNARRPLMHEIYRAYRDRCLQACAMDFDDLLYYTYRLFTTCPQALEVYREAFSYVLVDEYQDTNFAQYTIVNLLCRGRGNLTVVGDDAQSIYSFRGANIRNILDLDRAYPDLRTFKLEHNYRSTSNIINAAGTLIEKNKHQIPKTVFSTNGNGSRITVSEAYSDQEEARIVASRISSLKMKSGDSYEEFAILYRTNAQSRTLEEALRQRNIPYRIYGGLSFYQRKEVKDAVCYFRLALNPNDDEALRRVINVPARGIGDTTLNKLTRCAMDNKVSIWQVITNLEDYDPGINAGTTRKIKVFTDLIESFNQANESGKNAFEMAQMIVTRTGLMLQFMSENTPENISRRENIEELIGAAQEVVETRQEQGIEDLSLGAMMTEISLATDQDTNEEDITERITLMTVHAAKGLEFNNVFIVGVEEDLFPSSMSQETPEQVEEERRLLYVAITRARNVCEMTFSKSRFRNGMTNFTHPSRFLADIDRQYLNYHGSSTITRSRPVSAYDTSSRQPKVTVPRGANAVSLNSVRASSPAPAPSLRPQRPGDATMTKHKASELHEGMRIRHATFGAGTITEIDVLGTDDRIKVEFDNDDGRVLMLKFAKFEILQ